MDTRCCYLEEFLLQKEKDSAFMTQAAIFCFYLHVLVDIQTEHLNDIPAECENGKASL
jgi:hypothetical protein